MPTHTLSNVHTLTVTPIPGGLLVKHHELGEVATIDWSKDHYVLTVIGAPAKHVGSEYMTIGFSQAANVDDVLAHVSYLCDNVFTTEALA